MDRIKALVSGRIFCRLALLALAAFALPGFAETQGAAEAQNSVESIDYTTQPGGKIVVRIGLKKALSQLPAGFTVNSPPRIALDLPDTANGLGKNLVEADEGVLKSINIVQAGNRTRLVANLKAQVGYELRNDGRNLLLVVQSGASPAGTGNVGSRFSEAPQAARGHGVRDLDFRRGKEGEGKVVVDLSDTGVGIDIRPQGKNLVIDFANTSLPPSLKRRLDVADFGTPVQAVEAFEHNGGTRLVVEPRGRWEHSAYQTDRQFIVEVKETVDDPTRPSNRRGIYSGDKLSLNFQNVEVRAVLQVIADFTGLNIVTSDTVNGNLTLRLKDVPWDQALDLILNTKGLSMRKNGNVVWIAPTDELATREKLELEAKQYISDLEPVHTESFQLKYQKGDALKTLLSDSKQQILSKRGSVVVDARTNTLFVQDTPSKLEQLRKLITQIDVPVKQVSIEARVVVADDRFSKQLGSRFTVANAGRVGDYNIGVGGTDNDSLKYASGRTVETAAPNVNLPAAGAPSIGFTLIKIANGNLVSLELSALEADRRGKVISSPRVVTADKQKAIIKQGTQIPYLQATSSGATSVVFKDAVLSLEVTPQITPDDTILMDLVIKKDGVGQVFSGIPSIDTREVQTNVLVENGGTAVLGGIYEQTMQDAVSKVPLLGDIPVLGYLFRNSNKIDDKTELLIFITPKILKDNISVR